MKSRGDSGVRALFVTALLGFVLALPAPGAAAEFDRTLAVSPGARLDVRLYGGDVVLRAWNSDKVRVRAMHFDTDEIQFEAAGTEVRLRARTRTGARHGIDLEIDLPAWMPFSIVGPYLNVVASGTRSDVTVETVRGDVRVRGGDGAITLSSIEGQVVLEDSRGAANVRAPNNGIRVSGFEGTLQAETVDGSVRLIGVSASRARVSTMAGDILWEAPLVPGGSYELTSHSGDIDVTLPAAASATISVRALEGHLRTLLPAEPRPQGGHSSIVVGGGGPRLAVETFNGIVSLRQSGREVRGPGP